MVWTQRKAVIWLATVASSRQPPDISDDVFRGTPANKGNYRNSSLRSNIVASLTKINHVTGVSNVLLAAPRPGTRSQVAGTDQLGEGQVPESVCGGKRSVIRKLRNRRPQYQSFHSSRRGWMPIAKDVATQQAVRFSRTPSNTRSI